MELAILNKKLAMDSRDIAKLTHKRHADVMRDIRDMLEKMGAKMHSSFESKYFDTYGREKLVLSLLKYTSSVFTNISSNIHVRFSKNSISKLSSDKAIKKSIVNGFSIKDHFEAAKNIKELFENAELFGKFKDRDNDPNIIAMYRFQIPVKMGFAYITTKEVKIHGNRMYSIEILLNKKSLPLSKDERSRLIKSVTNGFIAIPTTKYIIT